MTDPKSQAVGWRELYLRREVIAWALYDWGNSAFATSVLVGFFPLAFNQMWSDQATGSETTEPTKASVIAIFSEPKK